jgi:hypothetical protein
MKELILLSFGVLRWSFVLLLSILFFRVVCVDQNYSSTQNHTDKKENTKEQQL